MLSSYVKIIIQVITPAIRDQSTFVEVKPDSEKKYNEILHEAIGKTIFNNVCFSVSSTLRSDLVQLLSWIAYICWQYFIDQKTPKNRFIYPSSSFDMWCDTHLGLSNEWIYDLSLV